MKALGYEGCGEYADYYLDWNRRWESNIKLLSNQLQEILEVQKS